MAGGQALEGARAPAFRMDPWDIKVPGRDKVGKSFGPPELIKAHEGRLDIAWKPGFVESIVADGVWETVVVWKDADGTPWCVDGVQRVLAAREAIKLREAANDDREVLVPTLSPAGKLDDVTRFALSMKLNHLRHDDPPLVEAAKVAELFKMARGRVIGGRQSTEAEAIKLVAEATGKATAQVRDALKLDAAPSDQKHEVIKGTLSPTATIALQAAPAADQGAILADVRRTGAPTAARVKEAVRRSAATRDGTSGDDAKVTPSKATIRRLYEADGTQDALDGASAWQILQWIHGDRTARGVPGLSPHLNAIDGGAAE